MVLMIVWCQAQPVWSRSRIADPHALRAMMSSLAKNLEEMSDALVPIAERLAVRSKAKTVEHVLILNELLLIKTVIDYEARLTQTYRLIRDDAQVRYYNSRIDDMTKSKEKINLALQRINRHATRIRPSSQAAGQTTDVNGLLAVSKLTNTVEKVLVLLNMSIDYLKSAIMTGN